MIEVKIDLGGLDRLIGDQKRIGNEVADAMATEMLRESQARVPVDTGRLKKSGSREAAKDGRATVKYTAPYATAVHFSKGTGSQFLRSSAMSPKIGAAAAAAIARRLR